MTPSRVIANIIRMIGVALAMAVVLPLSVWSAQLETYRARVDSAFERAIAIEELLRDDELDESIKRDFIAQIRRDFPSTETINWTGGSVEASHNWLLGKINELEQSTDIKTSIPIVLSVREHLSAVAFKLSEIRNAASSGRTKDEDKQKLAEILRREEYQKPQASQESAFQRALRSFLEWLMDLWPKPPNNPEQTFTGFGSLIIVLQVILYLGLAALVIFLIVKLVPLFFPSLRRARSSKPKKRIILGEEIGEDEVASDIFDEAEQLARQGQLRAAIRKGYIALLCDLSDRRIIGLARHKTNRDYVRDVRSRRELHPRLQSVTDTFELHWYGLKKSDDDDWARFTEEYKEAVRSI